MLSAESRLLLKMRQRQFEETKNPIFAIEAFLIARGEKLFPPMWVLDWLGTAFKTFHDAQGMQSLERILGLVPGRGQSLLFKALIENQRDEMLAVDMWRVIVLFNTSIETAAEMVISRLKETPNWNKSVYKILILSVDTLVDRYKRKWKKLLDATDTRHRFLSRWTRSEADAYLKRFPSDSYQPEDIRPTLTR